MPTSSSSSSPSSSPPPPEEPVLLPLLPIVGTVFAGFLVTGLALPILPLHVYQDLGLGTFVVGLVSGAQFGASLLSRLWSGRYADQRGGKPAVVVGLVAGVIAGFVYLLSLLFLESPALSAAVLLAGRALLGASESLIITGALAWGMAIVSARSTGKVMVWVGTAIYVAFAIGAPAGTALFDIYGFAAIALATIAVPLVTLVLIARRHAAPPPRASRAGFGSVLGAVWLPGVGLALCSVGFGAITTFLVLLFAHHGWGYGWLGFTLLSVTFVLGRVLFGHLPDRIGGAPVALVCVLVEAAGQAFIWLSPWPALVLFGTALTGLGYSLVYPGFGLEAVRLAPPEGRAFAMGAFTAFLDVALGLTGPALGLVAGAAGFDAVYLVSTAVVLCSAGVAIRLLRDRPSPKD